MRRSAMVNSLFLCSILVFILVLGGSTHSAFANGTAADARDEGTEEAMRAFLLNVAERKREVGRAQGSRWVEVDPKNQTAS